MYRAAVNGGTFLASARRKLRQTVEGAGMLAGIERLRKQGCVDTRLCRRSKRTAVHAAVGAAKSRTAARAAGKFFLL